MPYNPNLYTPMQFPPPINYPLTSYPQAKYQSGSMPVMYIVPVSNFAEVKEYVESPGSEPPLFMLQNDNVFIKKEVDQQGGVKFSAFRFSEIPLSEVMPEDSSYVTKADFDLFANKVMEAINGKSVVESPDASTSSAE